jgi:hypothetical protein
MRRLRPGWIPPASPVRPRLLDDTGQPITFHTPGDPTPEERRRYAQAVQRATTPAPLSSEQQNTGRAIHQRRRQLLSELGVYVND